MDSFQIASDFWANLTMHIDFEIRYASMFTHVQKNSAIFIFILDF